MINFSKVEHSVRQLKSQVAAGEIDQGTFETRLVEMIDVAADGYYWMFGHESETWYQHDGTRWIPKDPGELRLLTPKDDSLASPSQPNNPHSSLNEQNQTAGWKSVNWGWFVASLIFIGLVAGVVYASSLV